MSDYHAVIIKQVTTEGMRDLLSTSRYMQKLQEEGHEVPTDDLGVLAGSVNCLSKDRPGQLKEINHYLTLHGNLKSSQAASHQVISYPSGFTPNRQQIVRDIHILLEKYGMQSHPMVWDAHIDTDNFHVHLLICRVSQEPNAKGEYLIADNGLVKSKITKEKTKSGKLRVRGPRTDWSACRQSAIHEIGEAYGWPPPENLRCTKEGKPRPRQTPKDRHSDGTKAKERQTGKKSKQRLLAEFGRKVFDSAAIESVAFDTPFWSIADQDFMKVGVEQVLKIKDKKVHGAYLIGPDGQKCKFSNIGPEYSIHALLKRFGLPSQKDVLQNIQEYIESPFEYPDEITVEEAKKRLKLIFEKAVNEKDWNIILDSLSESGMRFSRSGGGAVIRFNEGKDSIKLSEVANKFSMKQLESVMGPCPIASRDKTSPENTNLTAIAKAKKNGAILMAIVAMKYKHMNMKNTELSDDKSDYVSQRGKGMDFGESENFDITPNQSMFTM